MSCDFPSNPPVGLTYDCSGFHYIFDGSGWVNKSIYGVSAGNGIYFTNYNATGPVQINTAGLSAGGNIGISISGNTYTISFTGGSISGPTGPTGHVGATGADGGNAGKIYYFWAGTTADVSGYKVASAAPSPNALTTITVNVTNGSGDVHIASFITDPSEPGVNSLPVGVASRFISGYLSVGNGEAKYQFKLYKRNSGGTETLLRDGYSPNFTNNTSADNHWFVAYPTAFDFEVTDRLVFKLYATRVSGPNNFDVITEFEDNKVSRVQTTISAGAVGPRGATGATGATPTDYVSSFNGLTGAVQGVSAAVAGTGISVSGATGSVTFTNTGALLTTNTFTGVQTFNTDIVVNSLTVGKGGTGAGVSNTCVAIGNNALQDNTGVSTVGIGQEAGKNNTGASNCVFIGQWSGVQNSASSCLGIGSSSLYQNTGSSCVGVGTDALYSNDGHYCVGIGLASLGYAANGNQGSSNVAIGYYAGNVNSDGTRNTFIGKDSGQLNTTGSDLVFVGCDAGDSCTTGIQNICIGSSADIATASDNNSIVVGYNAVGLGSNTTVVGNSSTTSTTLYGTLNINSASISAGLSVSGGITFNDGIVIPVNASNAITIGTDATRKLTVYNNAGDSFIAQTGASNRTLNIQHEGFGAINIGDVAGSNNNTYITVNDDTATIDISAVLLNWNGTDLNEVIQDTSSTMIAGGTHTSISTSYDDTAGTLSITNTGVHSFNGATGSVGGMISPVGHTGSIPVFTYPDGVTTYNAGKTPYYQPFWSTIPDASGYVVRENRTYFSIFSAHKQTNIKTIRIACANTVTTGNVMFSVWSANATTGFPETNLYTSTSVAVASGYSYPSVTNSSGLITVPAGLFYLAMTFSSTPTIYSSQKTYRLSIYGSPDLTSGYRIEYLVADTSTFSVPSSIYGAGVTFAGVDRHASTYNTPRIEYAPKL